MGVRVCVCGLWGWVVLCVCVCGMLGLVYGCVCVCDMLRLLLLCVCVCVCLCVCVLCVVCCSCFCVSLIISVSAAFVLWSFTIHRAAVPFMSYISTADSTSCCCSSVSYTSSACDLCVIGRCL